MFLYFIFIFFFTEQLLWRRTNQPILVPHLPLPISFSTGSPSLSHLVRRQSAWSFGALGRGWQFSDQGGTCRFSSFPQHDDDVGRGPVTPNGRAFRSAGDGGIWASEEDKSNADKIIIGGIGFYLDSPRGLSRSPSDGIPRSEWWLMGSREWCLGFGGCRFEVLEKRTWVVVIGKCVCCMQMIISYYFVPDRLAASILGKICGERKRERERERPHDLSHWCKIG